MEEESAETIDSPQDPEMVNAFVDFWAQSIHVDEASGHAYLNTKSEEGSRSLTDLRKSMKVV